MIILAGKINIDCENGHNSVSLYRKLSECLNTWIKTLTQSDSTWVAALSEVRDWKTGWIWVKLVIYFCLWFTTLSQHTFFFFWAICFLHIIREQGTGHISHAYSTADLVMTAWMLSLQIQFVSARKVCCMNVGKDVL